MHRQIREALVAAVTGLPLTGARVYTDLGRVMAAADLPGLRVGEDGEEADSLTVHAPEMQARRLSVLVEACVKDVGSPDNSLDQAAKEVEAALASGLTIGSIGLACHYRGMTRVREEADSPVGVKRLRYEIPFHTLANAPDVLI